jgi:hypothetical protein
MARECPKGYTESPTTHKCKKIVSHPETPPICPRGYIRNPITNSCKKVSLPPLPLIHIRSHPRTESEMTPIEEEVTSETSMSPYYIGISSLVSLCLVCLLIIIIVLFLLFM